MKNPFISWAEFKNRRQRISSVISAMNNGTGEESEFSDSFIERHHRNPHTTAADPQVDAPPFEGKNPLPPLKDDKD